MTKTPNSAATATKSKELTPEELNEKIALTGNLADLSPAQRMAYYERYCRHLGLDPITRPFDVLTTFEENGAATTKLYANASCSSQLADKREVTYGKPETEYNEKLGLLTIHVQATMPSSAGTRSCWRRGVAHVDGLKGKRLENAIKKAETQAHRRATLALCGVAMPDESEIEDIPGAQTTRLHANAPLAIPTAKEIFDDPRPLPDTPLPEAWTADTTSREIADQQIANQINAGLKKIADEVKAEAPKPDPTPGLTPTLTPSQQKVSDAVMGLYKEHKKAKADTLLVIEKFLGRPVKASKELSDDEAERVFAHLQTLMAALSEPDQPAPTKSVFGPNNRAHNAEIGKEIDEAIKRLTILQVPFAQLCADWTDMVEREVSGRRVDNRYALDDEEAQAVLIFLQDRIAEAERQATSEKPAEV